MAKTPDYPITRGSAGVPTSCQINAEAWLEHAGHADTLHYDSFLQRLMVGKDELTDELMVRLLSAIESDTRTPWRDQHLRNAIINLASQSAHSSLATWLDQLTWDHEPRLDTFFVDMCGAKDDLYSRACAQVLFLSAVARAYQPGCQADVMVVLIGRQGIGKSKSLISLVPDESWFTDDLGGDFHERRASEALQGKWLIEFGEFARINRSTNEMVKAFVTRRTDRYRPAYGRIARDHPRQCIFIGTTNNHHPLQDLENRRFMPLTCPDVFIDVTPIHRDHLWGEAVHRYRAGEPWWLTEKPMIEESKAHQEDARQADAWEEILSVALASKNETRMADIAEALGIKPDRLDKPTQTRLGLVMQALGWTRERRRMISGRGYVYRRTP